MHGHIRAFLPAERQGHAARTAAMPSCATTRSRPLLVPSPHWQHPTQKGMPPLQADLGRGACRRWLCWPQNLQATAATVSPWRDRKYLQRLRRLARHPQQHPLRRLSCTGFDPPHAGAARHVHAGTARPFDPHLVVAYLDMGDVCQSQSQRQCTEYSKQTEGDTTTSVRACRPEPFRRAGIVEHLLAQQRGGAGARGSFCVRHAALVVMAGSSLRSDRMRLPAPNLASTCE